MPDIKPPTGLPNPPCPFFTVLRRNPGHWDITDRERRLFRIRGGPGQFLVLDERRQLSTALPPLKSLDACMAYITAELMTELIVTEGQVPTVIEAWNI